MSLPPFFRKCVLLLHVVVSVGWLGAIIPYAALALTGLQNSDAALVRASYLSMELIGKLVIVPLSLAALLSGFILSLGTPWGLFRHWWVTAKLLLTAVATTILMLHMQTVSIVAAAARATAFSATDLQGLRIQLVIHAIGGFLVVFALTALSVFKPWGLTPLGKRRSLKTGEQKHVAPAISRGEPVASGARWRRIAAVHAAIVFVVVVAWHIASGGLHHH